MWSGPVSWRVTLHDGHILTLGDYDELDEIGRTVGQIQDCLDLFHNPDMWPDPNSAQQCHQANHDSQNGDDRHAIDGRRAPERV